MNDYLDNFLVGEFDGLPLAMTPNHDDDCKRWDWHVKIGGKWHEIESCSLRFDRVEAAASIKRILEREGAK